MSAGMTDESANLREVLYNFVDDESIRWPGRYNIAADLTMKARLLSTSVSNEPIAAGSNGSAAAVCCLM